MFISHVEFTDILLLHFHQVCSIIIITACIKTLLIYVLFHNLYVLRNLWCQTAESLRNVPKPNYCCHRVSAQLHLTNISICTQSGAHETNPINSCVSIGIFRRSYESSPTTRNLEQVVLIYREITLCEATHQPLGRFDKRTVHSIHLVVQPARVAQVMTSPVPTP